MMKPLVKNILQIGLVVHNVEQTVRKYRQVLGQQPWNINYVDTRNGVGKNFKKGGRTTEIKAKIAWIQLGNVEIELIEPLDQDSVYYDQLVNQGPGLHHIMFEPVEFDQCDQQLQQQGHAVLGEGELQQTRFKLFDCREDLGLIFEIAEGEPLVPDTLLQESEDQ